VRVVDRVTLLSPGRSTDGSAKMGIVIPWNFSQRLTGMAVPCRCRRSLTHRRQHGQRPHGLCAGRGQGYSSSGIQLDWLRRTGNRSARPVSVDVRTWFNEDLESSAFIIPGVLALVMSVIGAFLTSLTIAREWERGSMEQLISTPVTAMEIMLGKLAPYFVLACSTWPSARFIAIQLVHVPFRGSYLTLAISSALFMIVVLSLGFFISVSPKISLPPARLRCSSRFFPHFCCRDFSSRLNKCPLSLQWITRILPARYYVSVLKKIFLKGTPTRCSQPI
jgi:ABC-2 type transport system permease protein